MCINYCKNSLVWTGITYLLCLLCVIIACGEEVSESSEDIDSVMESHSGDDHGGHQTSGTDEMSICQGSPCFKLEWQEVGNDQQWQVQLLDATPNPPIQGLNEWKISVTDTMGEALSNCKIDVSPYMPDHQHGSRDVVATWIEADQYQIKEIDLIMPGLWEIRLTITCDELMLLDRVTFAFWLDP
jgi:hypothetical protein